MRGVYKREVKKLTGVQNVPIPQLQTVTAEHRSLMERLLAEQERLIVSVILLESQLTGVRPLKQT